MNTHEAYEQFNLKPTYILDEEGEELAEVGEGTHVTLSRIDPETFPGFWAGDGRDLPDDLEGPLYGTVQDIVSDQDGRVTYMAVGLFRECDVEDYGDEYPPVEQGDETKYGVHLRVEDTDGDGEDYDSLAEFVLHVVEWG